MSDTRKPVSFIATSDPDAARRFYGEVLGLTLQDASDYALAFSETGHTLRIQIVRDHQPASYTAHGWQVADIAHQMATLSARGVVFCRYKHLDQSATGVWTTPDGHQIAWFKDPGGNILSLTQYA